MFGLAKRNSQALRDSYRRLETNRRIGALFMVGAGCFSVASIPALAAIVPGVAIGVVNFAGSVSPGAA